MGVRRIRSEMNINPGKRLPLLLSQANDSDIERLERQKALLVFVARLDDITVLETEDGAPESAVSLVDHLKLMIPMAGLIDKDAELARLTKETDRLTKEVARLSGKLGNPGFTAKAPAKVVELEQQKLNDAQASLTELEAQRARISAL